MTEAEWLVCEDPEALVGWAHGYYDGVSDRKLRLFACGCCRLIADLGSDSGWEEFVGVVERFADGAEGLDGVSAAFGRLSLFRRGRGDADWMADSAAEHFARVGCLDPLAPGAVEQVSRFARAARPDVRPAQVRLAHCILGNPFRPVAVDAHRITSTVKALAEALYADRAFDRLPILADALEDAGCDSSDLLAHLRGPGPHARGCWALDLVLGRT